MEKPASLRRVIENALPDLKANPDKLNLWIEKGNIHARKGTLGHTQKYRLSVGIIDLNSRETERLFITIIDWLQVWQPELLGMGQTNPEDFHFEIDILGNETTDIMINLALSEDIQVKLNENRTVTAITHRRPPQHYNDLTWPLLNGEQKWE